MSPTNNDSNFLFCDSEVQLEDENLMDWRTAWHNPDTTRSSSLILQAGNSHSKSSLESRCIDSSGMPTNIETKCAAFDCKVAPIASSEYPTKASRPHYSLMDTKKIKDPMIILD